MILGLEYNFDILTLLSVPVERFSITKTFTDNITPLKLSRSSNGTPLQILNPNRDSFSTTTEAVSHVELNVSPLKKTQKLM